MTLIKGRPQTLFNYEGEYNMETLLQAFEAKHPTRMVVATHFKAATGQELDWNTVTKNNLRKFKDYLRDKYATNTARSYCSQLRDILSENDDIHPMPKGYKGVLAVKTGVSQHTYLNEEEIARISAYQPTCRGEWIIRNQFLAGCYTGARHSDYIAFSNRNIHDNVLKYVSVKTNHDTVVPVCPALLRIIRENEEQEFIGVTFSEVYFNRTMKKICRKVGIDNEMQLYVEGKMQTRPKWGFITSHTARRSFATNLYLNGVDIYTISRMCGHTSVDMTKTYICCPPKIDAQTQAFFDRQK